MSAGETDDRSLWRTLTKEVFYDKEVQKSAYNPIDSLPEKNCTCVGKIRDKAKKKKIINWREISWIVTGVHTGLEDITVPLELP